LMPAATACIAVYLNAGDDDPDDDDGDIDH
jgi:hypothetical protein